MINLKVKTLDSQNHDFSVEETLTVRLFKELISDKTAIPADSQRLIYCGRVLMDEKPLSDYDLNGKVVHLVQRAPPSNRPNNNGNSGNTQNPSTGNMRAPTMFRTLDGMMLGAMSIPVNASNGTPQAAAPPLNPSSTLCMNRITVARYMLECANNIAAYLEDPTRGLNNAPMDILSHQTMESTVLEVGISAVSDVEIPQHQMQNFVEAFQGAISTAFRNNGMGNVAVIQQQPTATGANGMRTLQQVLLNAENQAAAAAAAATGSAPLATDEPTLSTEANTSTTTTTEAGETPSTTGTPNPTANATPRIRRQQTTSPRTLAEVVQQMRQVSQRLEPFFQQYYDILQNDVSFDEEHQTDRENSQRVFDRVSEAFHYISHAQHAISDLMLDLSTTTPRHLCCRPILVEQSAYVSSGIVAPNNIHHLASVLRPNGPTESNNNNQTTGEPAPAQQAQQQQPTVPTVPTQEQPEGQTENQATPNEQRPNVNMSSRFTRMLPSFVIPVPGSMDRPAELVLNLGNMNRNSTPPIHISRLIQAVVNSAPGNSDVHVEFQAPRDPASDTQSSVNDPDLTINIQLGDNSQPRVTTATHPTTSTQTRSTARPQVHLTGLPAQVRSVRPVSAHMMSGFDRFLQCNSHHISEHWPAESRPRVPVQYARRGRSTSAQRCTRPPPRTANEAATVPPPRMRPTTSVASPLDHEFNTTINLFGSTFTIRDLMYIVPTPHTLNRIRDDLNRYVGANIFMGRPVIEENSPFAIDFIMNTMERMLIPLSQYDLPDYDSRRSIENLIRRSFTKIFVIIGTEQTSTFGIRILNTLITLMKRFFMILITCVGRTNAETYLTQMAQEIISSEDETEQASLNILQRHLLIAARRELDTAIDNNEEVQEFLVIRRPAPGSTPVVTTQQQPMETDENESLIENVTNDVHENEAAAVIVSITNNEIPSTVPMTTGDESIPEVIVGSEAWHSNFPSNWLPVITRDISRQRRQSTQGPFSDAYISGMSSKRRKLISTTKTSPDVPTLLSEGVHRVVQTSGLNSTNPNITIDDVSAAISTDTAVQSSYREAMKSSVQERLKNDPDFNAERFPNSSKYFNNQ